MIDPGLEVDRIAIMPLVNVAEVAAAVLLSFGPEDCILKEDLRQAAAAVRTRLNRRQEVKTNER